jgi:hypothetical protein
MERWVLMVTYFKNFGTTEDDTFTCHNEDEDRRQPVHSDRDDGRGDD